MFKIFTLSKTRIKKLKLKLKRRKVKTNYIK